MFKSYVYYNVETGEVIGISNVENKEHGSYIIVDHEEVKEAMLGIVPFKFLSVVMDIKTKKFVLKNKKNIEDAIDSSNVNEFLYEVPDTYSKYYDILIEQNCKEKCWKILIGKELQTALTDAHFDKVFDFSITKKRNPNIFYKRLEFDMRHLVSISCVVFPFTDKFEIDNTPISLYTNKKFDVYTYRKVENEI